MAPAERTRPYGTRNTAKLASSSFPYIEKNFFWWYYFAVFFYLRMIVNLHAVFKKECTSFVEIDTVDRPSHQ